jgi:hypothetical protein
MSSIPDSSTSLRAQVGRMPSAMGSRKSARARTLCVAATLLFTTGIATAADAAPVLSGRVFLEAELLGTSVRRNSTSAGPVLADSASGVGGVGDLGDGSGEARYQAEFGRLRAAGRLDTTAPATEAFALYEQGATGIARFEDVITMNAPGLAGTQGSVRVRTDVHGALRGEASGADDGLSSGADAGWVLNLLLGDHPANARQRVGGCSLGGGLSPVDACVEYGDGFGVWTTEPVTFTFGVPTSLWMELGAGVFTRTVRGGRSTASSDLFSTVEWLDMVDVRDALGRPVSGFSVSSASGTDWAARMPIPFDPGTPTDVPAPPAIAMLGVVAMALLRRRVRGLEM